MGARKKTAIYRELGSLLKNWRSKKYQSALAMYRAKSFSFSYPAYADFERGLALPPPKVLLEISHFLRIDEHLAFSIWTQVQMPTADLKSAFEPSQREATKKDSLRPPVKESHEARETASFYENIWIFGERERKAIEHCPRLLDFFLFLQAHHPAGINKSDLSSFRLKETDLEVWLKKKCVLRHKNFLRLALPEIYIPRTRSWNRIRENQLNESFRSLLKTTVDKLENTIGYSFEFLKKLNLRQQEFVLQKLKTMERDLSRIPSDASPASDAFRLLVLFGLNSEPSEK